MPDKIVPWREWEAATFEHARASGRPILLFLSASWCHWCHVMEDDTLAHPEVARLLDEKYVPIRVDSDKRPDVNNRYNMGGWPSVVILTADGNFVAGDTYLPPGPMIQMLHRFYGEKQADSRTGRELPNKPLPVISSDAFRGKGQEVIDRTAAWMKRTYDSHFGGFMGPMKFPMPVVLDLASILHRRDGDGPWLRMLTETLDSMRDREIHDVVDGGFFRYSVSDDWSQPHFEKMLETQSQLLVTYLSAYFATDDSRYRVTAEDILRYSEGELWDSQKGWFGGSQTADPDYYQSSEEDRLDMASPAIDRTLFVDGNASMATGLLRAGVLLRKPEYTQQALSLLGLLTERCMVDEKGAVHYYSDKSGPSPWGFLGDQSALLCSLLDAYEYTAQPWCLEKARGLIDTTINEFWDEDAGRFRDRVMTEDDRGMLRKSFFPLAENCAMAQALVRASVLTEVNTYRSRAEQVLMALHGQYEPYRLYAAPYALAMDQFIHPPICVSVVASFGDPVRESFVTSVLKSGMPWVNIEHLDPESDSHRLDARGFTGSSRPAAYLCVGNLCHPPVSEPAQLQRAICALVRKEP